MAGLRGRLISTGLALLTWTFMMRPIAEDHSIGMMARLVSAGWCRRATRPPSWTPSRTTTA